MNDKASIKEYMKLITLALNLTPEGDAAALAAIRTHAATAAGGHALTFTCRVCLSTPSNLDLFGAHSKDCEVVATGLEGGDNRSSLCHWSGRWREQVPLPSNLSAHSCSSTPMLCMTSLGPVQSLLLLLS